MLPHLKMIYLQNTLFYGNLIYLEFTAIPKKSVRNVRLKQQLLIKYLVPVTSCENDQPEKVTETLRNGTKKLQCVQRGVVQRRVNSVDFEKCSKTLQNKIQFQKRLRCDRERTFESLGTRPTPDPPVKCTALFSIRFEFWSI